MAGKKKAERVAGKLPVEPLINYRLIVESSLSGIFIVQDYRFVYVNDAFARMHGYQAEELLGMPVLETIHPAEREEVTSRAANRCAGSPAYPVPVRRRLRKDGQVLYTEQAINTIEYHGKVAIIGNIIDVTGRRQAEAELKKATDMLEEAQAISKVGGWEYDLTTHTTKWTRETYRIYGVDTDHDSNDISRDISFYAPEERPKIEAAFRRAVEFGEPYDLRLKFNRASGEQIWVRTIGKPVIENGKVVRVSGNFVDVTETTKARQELIAVTARQEAILSAVPDIIMEVDAGKVYIWANKSGIEFFGADVIGKEAAFYFEGEQETYNKVQPLFNGNENVIYVESWQRRKDGQKRLLAWWCRVLKDKEGKIIGALSTARDITESQLMENALRESEEKYRLLAESSVSGIFIVQDDRYIYTNERYAQMHGYNAAELSAVKFWELSHPDDQDTARGLVSGAIRSGFVFPLLTRRHLKKNGEVFWVDIRGTVIQYEGKPAILGNVVDVTDRKRAEEEQRRSSNLESIGTLAGGIAHDFNNILTGILGNISLASLKIKPGDEIGDLLQEAEKASLRARDLTQQLLTFARGGAPVKKLTRVTGLIQDAATFALRGSNIKPVFSIARDLCSVEADQGQLSQCLHNIVLNAQQAMPTGGSIEITARNMDILEQSALPLKKGNYISIAIKDQGIGIREEHLPRIFDPYFTTKQKGSGLGLAVTYSIIKNHGGHIAVESMPGSGATFTIYLPASEQQAALPEEVSRGKPLPGKGRILVMDDEQTIRSLLHRILSDSGYEVELTGDGVEALESYKAAREAGQPFAAVILDLTIPGGMGGKETIKKLLEIDPKVKAIVSSGYASDAIMSEYQQHGFSAVVAKPYDIHQLTGILHNVLCADPDIK